MLTPSRCVERAQDAEQLLDDQRREAERRLVEQHQARAQHHGAADREHLLLAARERAGLLAVALLQAREIAVDALDVGGDLAAVAARHGADLQVLLDGLARERAAALRHMRDAEPHDVFGRACRDRLAVEADLAVGAAHAGERAQRGGLAGAVRAEQRGDAARPRRRCRGRTAPASGRNRRRASRASSSRLISSWSRDRRGSRPRRSAPAPACPRRSSCRNRAPPPCRRSTSPCSCDARPAGS